MVEVEEGEVGVAKGRGQSGWWEGRWESRSAAVGVEALDVMVLAPAERAGGRLRHGGSLRGLRSVGRRLLVEIGEGVGGERTQVLTVSWGPGEHTRAHTHTHTHTATHTDTHTSTHRHTEDRHVTHGLV